VVDEKRFLPAAAEILWPFIGLKTSLDGKMESNTRTAHLSILLQILLVSLRPNKLSVDQKTHLILPPGPNPAIFPVL
jgi:hypothetical protein